MTTNNTLQERNVEIKAKIKSCYEAFKKAQVLCNTKIPTRQGFSQKDTYFKVDSGFLKLREESQRAYLIKYVRPNQKEAKCSTFYRLDVADPAECKKILEFSHGFLKIIEKARTPFIYTKGSTDTRIHIDVVNGQSFIEFEVMLDPKQSIEEGEVIANELKEYFQIKEEDLFSGSYFDIFE